MSSSGSANNSQNFPEAQPIPLGFFGISDREKTQDEDDVLGDRMRKRARAEAGNGATSNGGATTVAGGHVVLSTTEIFAELAGKWHAAGQAVVDGEKDLKASEAKLAQAKRHEVAAKRAMDEVKHAMEKAMRDAALSRE